ncbi:hypothetical protein FA15DRAFT_682417 [Coprinopsis marcescibilis]|uniref:Helitron helicase-like domain-containing protein n=1 Tax=Coprinopsis marcescibilis TaxID=230819 RepID=A0A5C3KK14_COPMA|nr:hypothetical protein FA15DRAFT_682417 [Coprinopsis marcescibilis]
MFPTLYLFGISGFEDKHRPTIVSFESQAAYYLNLSDKSFRYHESYLFVTLNMIQRRKAHCHTSLLSSETLADVAEIIEHEKTTKSLDAEQKLGMDLLRYVNTIAEKIPGSYTAKISARTEIRSYFSYFGLPHLFFTFNPSPVHSPVFHVMYGDKTIDLSHRYPQLPSHSERMRRLAQDPVAAADFFEFSVRALFRHLFGWDYDKRQSSPEGGILGRLRTFYAATESVKQQGLSETFL